MLIIPMIEWLMNDLCEKRRGEKEGKQERRRVEGKRMNNWIQIKGESHFDLNQKKRKTDEREWEEENRWKGMRRGPVEYRIDLEDWFIHTKFFSSLSLTTEILEMKTPLSSFIIKLDRYPQTNSYDYSITSNSQNLYHEVTVMVNANCFVNPHPRKLLCRSHNVSLSELQRLKEKRKERKERKERVVTNRQKVSSPSMRWLTSMWWSWWGWS